MLIHFRIWAILRIVDIGLVKMIQMKILLYLHQVNSVNLVIIFVNLIRVIFLKTDESIPLSEKDILIARVVKKNEGVFQVHLKK